MCVFPRDRREIARMEHEHCLAEATRLALLVQQEADKQRINEEQQRIEQQKQALDNMQMQTQQVCVGGGGVRGGIGGIMCG